MLVDTSIVERIYNALADEQSRKVFARRLQYSMIDSAENHREIARLVIPEFIDKIESFTRCGDRVCVFGVGNECGYPGRLLLSLFDDQLPEIGVFDKRAAELEEITYFSGFNRNTSTPGLMGVRNAKVHPPEKIRIIEKNIVMIVGTPNYLYQTEIITDLISLGVPFERIAFIPAQMCYLCEDYFNHHFFEYNDKEVFIDCGCFDGQTSKHFFEAVQQRQGKVKKIIAFEPELANYYLCRNNMESIPIFEVRNLGVWNEKTTLSFHSGQRGSSAVTQSGDTEINAVKLDEELGEEKVTFIKMDVEGAELNALKGAENVIRINRPKLAISVYHRVDDIISIPEFIISLELDYRLFLRHQTGVYSDTILFGVPK